MKRIFSIFLTIIFLLPLFTSCEKEEDNGIPPELPPYESMAIDFSNFSDNSKAMSDLKTTANHGWAELTIFFWNVSLGSIVAVPVASFYASFNNTPEFIGNATWEWTYSVTGFTSTYSARLTGKIRATDVKWEMYLTKAGIGGFDEFKWFEGTSNLDGNSGKWTLFHSYEFQDPVLEIDWEKESEEIAMVKYTYVRENNDNGDPENFNGSYLEYGLQQGNFDAYYMVHAFNEAQSDYVDTYIEWSITEYFGHIKAQHIYSDDDWHCWDESGEDIDCVN